MKVTIAPDFRDLFRPLTPEEYEQAKINNQSDPNHERIPPVVLWENTIIDGHHTHRIRESLRTADGKPVKIRYTTMEFPDRQAAMAYAIHAQIGRRNLDPSQIAMALAKLPKTAPEKSPSGKFVPRSNPKENAQSTREELAEEAGIGRTTMKHADKVTEHGAAAVQDAVVAGDVSVSDAASIVDLPKGEQAKAVKAVKAGKAKTLKAAAKKPDKPAVSGPDTKALYQEWDRAIGPLVRLVDRIAGQVNGKRGEHHKTVQEHLNCATEEMMEWLGVSR